MRYMLLIYMAEDAMTVEERDCCYSESAALARELHARGQYVSASPLQPAPVATSVRVREGRRMVVDGPFAETKEQLGGYFMVDVKDLDEAIAIAARIPGAKAGTVEIRPVMELPGLPQAAG